MVALERIIRPFETRSIAPINLPLSGGGVPPANVLLIYGKNSQSGGGGTANRGAAATLAKTAGGTATSGHYSNSVTCYMTKQEKESAAIGNF